MASPMRRPMLAKVHIAKKQLGLSDDDWKALLEAQFGVESSSALNDKQLGGLILHLESKGATLSSSATRKKDTHGAPRTLGRRAMLDKIEALLAEKGAWDGVFVPWSYAASILARQTTKVGSVQRLEWATDEQFRAVIAALDAQLRRIERRVHEQAEQAMVQEFRAQLAAERPADRTSKR